MCQCNRMLHPLKMVCVKSKRNETKRNEMKLLQQYHFESNETKQRENYIQHHISFCIGLCRHRRRFIVLFVDLRMKNKYNGRIWWMRPIEKKVMMKSIQIHKHTHALKRKVARGDLDSIWRFFSLPIFLFFHSFFHSSIGLLYRVSRYILRVLETL